LLAERDKNNNQKKKNRKVLVQTEPASTAYYGTTRVFAVLCECKYGFKNARSNVVFTFALSDLQSLPGFPQKIPRFLPQPLEKKKFVERRTKGKRKQME